MFFSKGVNIFNSSMFKRYNTILMVVFLMLSACDPCRQLADKICQCKETEEERRACNNDLSLAGQHEYFSTAKEQSICEQALERNCSCEEINKGQDQGCGFYRPSAR